MKDISCNICDKREKCTKLCPSMIEHLQKISGKKLSYLDMTSYNSNKNIDDVEDLSLYTYGLSKIQECDVCHGAIDIAHFLVKFKLAQNK